MPLINCKIHLELYWTKICVMFDNNNNNNNNYNENYNNREFKITNTKLYVPIVTLSTEDNVKITKQLNERFKRSFYWNQCKIKMYTENLDKNNPLRILLDASIQGVKRLFVLAFDNINNDDKKVERDSHKKLEDYTTGCLLDYQCFKDHYQLIAVDISKQKKLDADPRTIKQTEFYEMLDTNSQVCTVLEKTKETVLQFYEGIAKVLWIYKWFSTIK